MATAEPYMTFSLHLTRSPRFRELRPATWKEYCFLKSVVLRDRQSHFYQRGKLACRVGIRRIQSTTGLSRWQIAAAHKQLRALGVKIIRTGRSNWFILGEWTKGASGNVNERFYLEEGVFQKAGYQASEGWWSGSHFNDKSLNRKYVYKGGIQDNSLRREEDQLKGRRKEEQTKLSSDSSLAEPFSLTEEQDRRAEALLDYLVTVRGYDYSDARYRQWDKAYVAAMWQKGYSDGQIKQAIELRNKKWNHQFYRLTMRTIAADIERLLPKHKSVWEQAKDLPY